MSVRRHRVTPFLWFDGTAEEAARHYVSVFKKGSRLTSVSPMSVTFDLEGQPFIALNGGAQFKFSEAVSLFVDCRDQREVDYYWERLSDGGSEGRCGWLKDRWGLSWQVVPRALHKVLNGRDKAGRSVPWRPCSAWGSFRSSRSTTPTRDRRARLPQSEGEHADMGERKKPGAAPRTRQASQLSEIDQFLASKQHPLEGDIQSVRKLILEADASIREEIKWNSISFRNNHDFFATVNLRSTDSVQLVLHTGVKKKAIAETGVRVDDPRGLIEKWPAKDRCIVTLGKGAALKGIKAALAALVKDWIRLVGPSR